MRKILAALFAGALALTGLVAASSLGSLPASAASVSSVVLAADTSAATPTAPAVGAVACIAGTDPHHNVKVFWTPGRVCPAGHYGIADAFGSASGTGAQGPKGDTGPAGPKGADGDSVAKVVAKSVTLTTSSPGTQTLVLTGLPAKSSSTVELPVTNAGEAPVGTTVTVVPVAPAAGSTERSFTVTASGFTGSQSFVLTVKILAVVA